MLAFLKKEVHELDGFRGRWMFGDKELMVPFECGYNETNVLRLEEGGRVYLVKKKEYTREELRVVDGEWSYDASDHWQSIFDPSLSP
jgi:hypothetical protein